MQLQVLRAADMKFRWNGEAARPSMPCRYHTKDRNVILSDTVNDSLWSLGEAYIRYAVSVLSPHDIRDTRCDSILKGPILLTLASVEELMRGPYPIALGYAVFL